MKTTNKLLMVLLFCLMILLTAFKIGFNSLAEIVPKAMENGYSFKKIMPEAFNEIDVKGRYFITIKQADTNYVEFTGPDLLVDKYTLVAEENGKLKISSQTDFGKYLMKVQVFIYAKNLSSLILSSGANVEMIRSELGYLSISASDTSAISVSGRLKNTYLKTKDNALVIVDNTVNADVDLSGNSQVSVSMNGGILKGSLKDDVDFGWDGNAADSNIIDTRKYLSGRGAK